MTRKTIQPSSDFERAIRNFREALREHRITFSYYTTVPVQSGPPPRPSKTALTQSADPGLFEGIEPYRRNGIDAYAWFQNGDLAEKFSTAELKEALEGQLASKTADVVSGIKSSEMRAIALQSQVLNGLRRRGARRQMNRLDRLAKAAYRRELLASNDGPLQSILVKRVEDTLARVNSST